MRPWLNASLNRKTYGGFCFPLHDPVLLQLPLRNEKLNRHQWNPPLPDGQHLLHPSASGFLLLPLPQLQPHGVILPQAYAGLPVPEPCGVPELRLPSCAWLPSRRNCLPSSSWLPLRPFCAVLPSSLLRLQPSGVLPLPFFWLRLQPSDVLPLPFSLLPLLLSSAFHLRTERNA